MAETNQTLVILRKKQVSEKTGLPVSSLYEKIRKGLFPKPIKLGARSSGWLESEVNAWIAAQVASRKAA